MLDRRRFAQAYIGVLVVIRCFLLFLVVTYCSSFDRNVEKLYDNYFTLSILIPTYIFSRTDN